LREQNPTLVEPDNNNSFVANLPKTSNSHCCGRNPEHPINKEDEAINGWFAAAFLGLGAAAMPRMAGYLVIGKGYGYVRPRQRAEPGVKPTASRSA